MKRTCALVLAFLLVFNIPALPVSAISISDEFTDTTISEKCTALTEELNQSRDLDLEISTTKELLDFDGNTYYVIEFDPTGYAIMHGSTGEIVEFGENAPSPYSGFDGVLYYGGPTYYYYLDGNECRHVWYDEVLSEEVIAEACELSAELDAEITTAAVEKAQTIQTQSTASTNVVNTTINGGWLLEALDDADDMGYWHVTPGVCGYIASGLVLLWHRYYDKAPELIDGFSYLYDNNTKFIDSDFTRKLRSFGDYNASSGDGLATPIAMLNGCESIRDVLTEYGESINVTINSSIVRLPTASTIVSLLKSKQKPMILFGRFSKTSSDTMEDHALVAYGYTSDGNILVHYGHDGYSKIVLYYSVIGESLYLDNYINDMAFSDVATTSWSYDAVSYCARYGIIDEYSGTTFQPSSGMTRGMFVNALYHLCGEPEVTTDDINDAKAQFTDYSTSTKYYKALAWAYREDLIKGIDTEGVTIAASTTITREQAVTFLYRFDDMIFYDYDDTNGPSVYDFDDYDDLHTYALTAMDWATERYIINGTGDNLLNPRSTMTKAQCAAMIYKFTNVAIYPDY